MDITKERLYSYLIYSSPIRYTEDLTLYPVIMDDIIEFNMVKSSIMLRKNSMFPIKKIIKMSYMDFLFYCYGNEELASEYNMPELPFLYHYALNLLKLVFKEQEVLANPDNGGFKINGVTITPDQFDDIRRIIILQNGIDFDIDEFIHYDTEKKLEDSKKSMSEEKSTIEDYIDSVCVYMQLTDEQVRHVSIRKFWRYVKRITTREAFNILKTAEYSGFVKLKQPVQHWMRDIEEQDRFSDVKTDAESIKKLVSG